MWLIMLVGVCDKTVEKREKKWIMKGERGIRKDGDEDRDTNEDGGEDGNEGGESKEEEEEVGWGWGWEWE